MQMAYGNKHIFNNFFKSITEKFDLQVEMLPEKENLWIYAFGKEWNIFILPFLGSLGYTFFKKNMVSS